jgi:hypothetical protein
MQKLNIHKRESRRGWGGGVGVGKALQLKIILEV